MRFRRKPTEIEAEQFISANHRPLPKGGCECDEKAAYHVHTMHANQAVVLKCGDWIIPEKDGVHFYPVDDKVFRETYEPAVDGVDWMQ